MKMTIQSTSQIVQIVPRIGAEPVPARVWEGVTEGGVKVQCFITRIAANKDQDLAQLEAELTEMAAPKPLDRIAMTLLLIL